MRGIQSCLLIFLIASFASSACAQVDTLWSSLIGNGPVLYGATELSDGDIAVVGVSNGDLAETDMYLARLSSGGEVRWTHTYSMAGSSESAQAVVELDNGMLVLVGDITGGSYGGMLYLLGVNSAGGVVWSRYYPGNGQTKGMDAVKTYDGNFVVNGFRMQPTGNHSDLWLLKCAPTGDTLWTRLMGGTDTDTGSKILLKSDGGFILGGSTKNFGAVDFDMWLVQTDSTGAMQSSNRYGTNSLERGYALAASDTSLYIGGYLTQASDRDGYLARTNLAGDSLWTLRLTNGMQEEQIRGIIPIADGSLLCAGWSGSQELVKPWMIIVRPDGSTAYNHIDSSFVQGWYNTAVPMRFNGGGIIVGSVIGTDGIRHGYALRVSASTGITGIVRCQTTGLPVGRVRVRVLERPVSTETSASGKYTLELSAGTFTVVTSANCYSPDTVRNVIVADTLTSADASVGTPRYQPDATSVSIVARNHVMSSTPLLIHNRGDGAMDFRVTTLTQFPPTNWLRVEPSSGVVPAGDSLAVDVEVLTDTLDDHVYDYVGWITVHANSCPDSLDTIPLFATVLGTQDRAGVPHEFALHDVYPNPFNSRTNISYEIPRPGRVRIAVYDVLGREAAVLVDRAVEPGMHSASFDGSRFGSGIYFVRMNAEGFSATRKVVMMK